MAPHCGAISGHLSTAHRVVACCWAAFLLNDLAVAGAGSEGCANAACELQCSSRLLDVVHNSLDMDWLVEGIPRGPFIWSMKSVRCLHILSLPARVVPQPCPDLGGQM